MSRYMKRLCFQRADVEPVTVGKNAIKLTAVFAKPITLIKNGAERRLYGGDVSADANITPSCALR